MLAGSLMAEGCDQLLQFYLLFLGFQTHTFDARFQPMPGRAARCALSWPGNAHGTAS